jgi:hypothetical protein
MKLTRLHLRFFLISSLLLALSSGLSAQAGVVTTDQYVGAESRTASQARVNEFLARGDVRAQLQHFGVNPDDAASRVAALTPEELAQLDQRIADLPAGGSLLAVVGVVFVVLMILELVGVTNIFTRF